MRKRRTRKNVHATVRRDAHKDGTYNELLEHQNGSCAICLRTAEQIALATGKPLRRLDIDHDHKTLAIRGLLCRGCNLKLRKGLTHGWLTAAAWYLDERRRDAA